MTLADNAEAFHDSLYIENEHITSYVNKGDGIVAVWSSALSDRYSNDTFYVNSASVAVIQIV